MVTASSTAMEILAEVASSMPATMEARLAMPVTRFRYRVWLGMVSRKCSGSAAVLRTQEFPLKVCNASASVANTR